MSATIVRLADFRTRKRKHARPKPPADPGPITVATAIGICLDYPEVLTVWEAGFLASIRRSPWLSVKQHDVLQHIFDKVCAVAEVGPI